MEQDPLRQPLLNYEVNKEEESQEVEYRDEIGQGRFNDGELRKERELYIIPELCDSFTKLTPAERRRVIVWLIDKFSINLTLR
jgi:hypothetical protein